MGDDVKVDEAVPDRRRPQHPGQVGQRGGGLRASRHGLIGSSHLIVIAGAMWVFTLLVGRRRRGGYGPCSGPSCGSRGRSADLLDAGARGLGSGVGDAGDDEDFDGRPPGLDGGQEPVGLGHRCQGDGVDQDGPALLGPLEGVGLQELAQPLP